VRDFSFPKSATLEDFKNFMADYLDLKPEEMLVVEEETERQINFLLEDEKLLTEFG
jgi:hypothetical protein